MARSNILALVLWLGVSGSFAMELKWCCIKGKEDDAGTSEFSKCKDMTEALNRISLTEGKSTTFNCVDREDCETTALSEGMAELVTLDAGLLYENMKTFNARPILSETYTADGTPGSYNATVYVKAETCTDTTSMASLKNQRACSTGYRKTAGWRIPIGRLMSSGAMPIVNEDCAAENDAESAAAFFSEMCAPGVVSKGGTGGDADLTEKLCKACKGDCTAADAYADYTGAFRGLAEGECDVAFAKHTTLDDASMEDWWGSTQATDFKVLCPFGGCIDYAQYDQFPECAWASTPSHATVVNPVRVGVSVVADVQAIFAKANDDAEFKAMFYKTAAGVVTNTNDLVFKSSTMGLLPVKTDMRTYLDTMYEVYQELETVAADTACSEAAGTPGKDGQDGQDGRDGVTNSAAPAATGPVGEQGVVYVRESDSGVPAWGVAVFVLVTVVLVSVSVLVLVMVRRERQGAPLFKSMDAQSSTIQNPL